MKLPQLLDTAKRALRNSFQPETTRRARQVIRKASRRALQAAMIVVPTATLATNAFAQNADKMTELQSKMGHPVQWWQAIILGLVQGLTEFIPVSSSAHLNLTHWLMDPSGPRELNYDVLLHIGTTAALAWYFRHDWKQLLFDPGHKRLRNLVILACVPAAAIGYKLRHVEDLPLFASPLSNATMLIIAGTVLFLADKFSSKKRGLETVTLKDSLVVGTSQAIALIPGVSRSGSTLTAGLLMGLKREDAARFSFLMSLPITLGAIAVQGKDVLRNPHLLNASPLSMLLGILVSGASGFWAIGFLLNYLKSKDVTPFFVWRVLAGLAVFVIFHFRHS